MSLKRIIIYSILPAMVIGLFSLIPMFWNALTTPKAELTYSLTSGAILHTGTDYRTIVSANVSNSGKKSLSNVVAGMLLEDGEIEAYNIEAEGGLTPIIVAEEQNISFTIPKFHPNENYAVSLMLILPDAQSTPTFSLRSDEVLGKLAPQITRNTDTSINLWGALLATFAAAIMVFGLLRNNMSPLDIFRIAGHKSDILSYIAARLQLPEVASRQLLAEESLTYLHAADILLSQGLLSSGKDRDNLIKALKCLLLIKNIANTSSEVIKNNIRILEGNDYSEEESTQLRMNSISVFHQLKLRNRINEYLENTILSPQNTKS